MNVTYWCYWYRKAISEAVDSELAQCEKDGKYCAVCKHCRLRRLDEVKS